ncbi:MAG: MerR family transcriptional regulator [Candidatus Cloacimonadota bacterium]|nr:MerR family transcriptional regulator [Candidatus Cloacimonadota bacterium]
MENKNKTKYYYSISEVCNITNLKSHVLRYWETEFAPLHPKRRNNSNRRYTLKDIKTIKKIKYLLYTKKYTIKGAKNRLRDEKKNQLPITLFDNSTTKINLEALKNIKTELINLKKLVNKMR